MASRLHCGVEHGHVIGVAGQVGERVDAVHSLERGFAGADGIVQTRVRGTSVTTLD
jgi:hypothetical protein